MTVRLTGGLRAFRKFKRPPVAFVRQGRKWIGGIQHPADQLLIVLGRILRHHQRECAGHKRRGKRRALNRSGAKVGIIRNKEGRVHRCTGRGKIDIRRSVIGKSAKRIGARGVSDGYDVIKIVAGGITGAEVDVRRVVAG